MEWNSGLKDRLSDDLLDQLSTTLAQLGEVHRGVGFVPLMNLARLVPQATSITVDFTKAWQIAAPLVVVAVRSDESDELSWNDLTPREKDVARLLATGLSNEMIARRLDITLGTAKCYVHRILAKTGTRNRASFASRARHHSLR